MTSDARRHFQPSFDMMGLEEVAVVCGLEAAGGWSGGLEVSKGPPVTVGEAGLVVEDGDGSEKESGGPAPALVGKEAPPPPPPDLRRLGCKTFVFASSHSKRARVGCLLPKTRFRRPIPLPRTSAWSVWSMVRRPSLPGMISSFSEGITVRGGCRLLFSYCSVVFVVLPLSHCSVAFVVLPLSHCSVVFAVRAAR